MWNALSIFGHCRLKLYNACARSAELTFELPCGESNLHFNDNSKVISDTAAPL